MGRMAIWRRKLKGYILESLGGKCVICGYNKCHRSLHLHHIDPSTKSATFTELLKQIYKWDDVLNEVRKCVLLCANCHGEVEDKITKLPDTYLQFDEKYACQKLRINIVDRICKKCNNVFDTDSNSTRYCINCRCAPKLKGRPRPRKVLWPTKNELEKLISNNTWVALGKMFGVTDNAVRKWARHYKII